MALKADSTLIQSLENKISNKLDSQIFNQYIGKMVEDKDSFKSNDLNKIRIEIENKADSSTVNNLGINIDGC